MRRWVKENWGAVLLAVILVAATVNLCTLPQKDLPKGVSHGEQR